MPHDRHLPEFLVPYDLKTGFQKNPVPIYICFKFKNWDEKHPRGEITRTIGPVNILSNFYEYQLACKNLDISLKDFTKNIEKPSVFIVFLSIRGSNWRLLDTKLASSWPS